MDFLRQIWNSIRDSVLSLWHGIQEAMSGLARREVDGEQEVQRQAQPPPLVSPSPELEEAKQAARQEGENARRYIQSAYPYLDPGLRKLGLTISAAEYVMMEKGISLEEVEKRRQTLREQLADFKSLVQKKQLIKQKAEVSLARFKECLSKNPNQDIMQDMLSLQKKIESAIGIKNYPKIESESVLQALEGNIEQFSGKIEALLHPIKPSL